MNKIRITNCIICYILVTIHLPDEADGMSPLLAWAQTSRRWTRLRAIMDPSAWIAHRDGIPYHLLLSSESGVDKSWNALGYDQVEQYMYWSDILEKRIYRQARNDTYITRNKATIELVYDGTSSDVNGIAVDWYSGAVYWTDSYYKRIFMTRANPGRQDLHKIIVDGMDEPSGIAVHPAKGELYFTDRGQYRQIEKASLLGENRVVVVGQDVGKPQCLTLDFNTDMLYWVDQDNYMVKSYNLNTRQVFNVIQGLQRDILWPGIANFKEYIFLSAQADLQIHAYNKNTGILVKNYTVDATPHHLVIAQQAIDPASECKSLECEHFCVSLGGGRGKCICAEGYYMDLDGKTCLSVEPKYIYSRGKSIWYADVTISKVNQEDIDMEVFPLVHDVSKVQALAFHATKGYLYFNDVDWDVLYRTTPRLMDTIPSGRDEITVNTRHVEGMTVNWISDTLYWADNTLGHIMCSKLNGRYHSILISDAGKPRGITVDAINSKLYWINDYDQNKNIMIADLDGKNLATFYNRNLNAPQGIAVDARTERVFWTDRSENKIYSLDISGNNIKEEMAMLPDQYRQFYGVTLFKDYTTWTMGNEDLQFGLLSYSRHIQSQSQYKPGYQYPMTSETYDVITYDSYMQPNTAGSDVCEGFGCQQHCFPTPTSARCGCAIGFSLREDGKSCYSEKMPGNFLIYVDPYHKQVYWQRSSDQTTYAIPLPLMDFPVSVAMDKNGYVYWIDRNASAIQRSEMLFEDPDKPAKLLRQIPSQFKPEVLAIDDKNKNVYYTDSNAGAIYRMALDGEGHGSVISGSGRCTGITLDIEKGLMFWSEVGSEARLMMANLDGSEARVLTNDAQALGFMPISLAYHADDQLLYWGDQMSGKIGSFNVTSMQMTSIFQDARYQIISLTVDNDNIYFTTHNEKGVYSIPRLTTASAITKLSREIFARIHDIRFFYDAPLTPEPVLIGAGTQWTLIGAGIAAAVLLLFLIFMIGLCAARKKRGSPPTPIIGSDTTEGVPYDNNVDQDYLSVTNATANGAPPMPVNGSIPPPPVGPPPLPPNDEHAKVHFTNNAFTEDENNTNGGVPGVVAVLPPGPVPKPSRKTKFKKKDQPSKQIDPNEFTLGDDKKVATVIHRLAHRLRNRLSSVRFSGESERPPFNPADQNQFDHQYDPENGDGVNGGVQNGRRQGPKKNITYPPQLHRPPRGFAPASHSVPTTTLSSWGKAKHNKMMGKRK